MILSLAGKRLVTRIQWCLPQLILLASNGDARAFSAASAVLFTPEARPPIIGATGKSYLAPHSRAIGSKVGDSRKDRPMELKDLEDLIKTRRSVRRWQDKKVPVELLTRAIEIATWAPNGGNRQNWRFYIIVDPKVIEAIADEVRRSTAQMASWPETAQFVKDVARWTERAGFFRTAPAAIAVAATQYRSDADNILAAREKNDAQARQMRLWRNVADSKVQSVASAVAYLLLVLHQMGLGAVWMTGPMQAAGGLARILKAPPNTDLIAFIPVGYPAETPAPRPRRPVAEVCEIVR